MKLGFIFKCTYVCALGCKAKHIHHHGSVQKKSESHYFKSFSFLSMCLIFSVSYFPSFSQPMLGIQEFPCLGIQEWPTFFPVTSHSHFMSCLLSSGLFRTWEGAFRFLLLWTRNHNFECFLTKRVNWTWMQTKEKRIPWWFLLLGGEQGMFSDSRSSWDGKKEATPVCLE